MALRKIDSSKHSAHVVAWKRHQRHEAIAKMEQALKDWKRG